ncbi:MAG: P27 family phage terminase small subunit [Bradyrhizobium sp.]|uniref:P27 family phage terminase small subunit n=1 Tax=Bradyrhizobium sp. TaxID=376 RepID=UPI003D0B910C
MTIQAFPGGSADIEEPDWSTLIPNKGKGKAGNNQTWRDYAHREWLRTVAALRSAGTLASENRHQIQRLVIAYIRYDRAAAELFRMGLVTDAPRTGTAMMNVYQTEMRHADSDATTAEMELGIPPRRRGSVAKADKKQRQGRAADEFLAKARG